MPIVSIETLADPRVADYQGVAQPDWLRRRNLFVAEGRLVVERLIARAVATPAYHISSMLLSDTALTALRPAVERVPHVTTYVCRAEAFQRLAGLNLHRGCLALAARPSEPTVPALVTAARLAVVLEGVGNPDNIGGIFRTAAAFGVDGIILARGCADPLYRKAIRTSMAAVFQVPFAVMQDWPHGLSQLRAAGFRLYALTPQQPSRPLEELVCRARPDRQAILLGAEGTGLSPEAMAHCDDRVRIPTCDGVDSLNVTVASGIVLSRLAPAATS